MDGLAVSLPAFLFVSHKGWLERASLTLSAGTRGPGREVALPPCHCTPFHTGSIPQKCSLREHHLGSTQAACKSDVICCKVHTAQQWQQNTKCSPGTNIYWLWEWFPAWMARICQFADISFWRVKRPVKEVRNKKDQWRCCKKWGRVIWIKCAMRTDTKLKLQHEDTKLFAWHFGVRFTSK